MMTSRVRSSLALVGLSAVLAPAAVQAQTAPAGYAPAPGTVMVMGTDGKPMVIQPAPVASAAPAPAHHHKFRTVCASCMQKQQAAMPTERIVACAHSKNGVCPTCQALLAMPGTVTMGAPAPAPGGEAPGRAMVSNAPATPPAPQYANQTAVYDPSGMADPAPVGVMKTNYAQPGAAPAAPSSVPTATSMMPGHALAESPANPAPFQHKPTSSRNPHIIGHLLGITGVGNEWLDQRASKKAQAHASIPYNNEGTTINELPASMVYGKP